LFYADAVFTRQAAAEFDAKFQYGFARHLSAVGVARLVGVVEDQGVQVAVAGVKNIGDLEVVFGADLADARQGVRQLRQRNGAVHAEIIRNTADGAERRFAAGPDAGALIGARTDDGCLRIVLRGDLGDAAEQDADFAFRAFDLDDQQGFDIQRIASPSEGFADFDCRPVHVFDGDRDDAGGDDANLAFRTDDEAQKIVAVAFERGAADFDDRAVDQYYFDAQDIVGRDAV